jgi:hypothetical protein
MTTQTTQTGGHTITRHGNTRTDRMETARRRHMRWVTSRVITCHGERAETVIRDAWGITVICGECQQVGRIH